MRTAPAGLREVERVLRRMVFGELQVRDLRHRGAEEHLRQIHIAAAALRFAARSVTTRHMLPVVAPA